MTWLAFRRHRTLFLVFVAVVAVLDVWMLRTGHGTLPPAEQICGNLPCQEPSGVFAPARQAAVLDLVLLALPCLLGVVFGTSLVAGEYERSTHRLAWTQQRVSRTRWYLTSWAVVAGALTVLVALELPVAHWWAGAAWIDLPQSVAPGGSRIQPNVFGLSGVVPLAYTLFALALGTTAGAVTRRVGWAAASTVVVYAAVAVVLVVGLRTTFAPATFLVNGTTDSVQYAHLPSPPPWVVGYEYRRIPGSRIPSGARSPDQVARACAVYGIDPRAVVRCMSARGVEGGFMTQPARNYWRLQWIEAGVVAGLTALLFGLGLLAVRRSQD